VAHDYNNMLGVTLTNADIAMHHMPLERPERKRLEVIIRAAQHSAELTAQLLAFARQQPVNPRLLNLNEEIASPLAVLGCLVGSELRLNWASSSPSSPPSTWVAVRARASPWSTVS
jgi:signal transduction histidine kinase